MTSTCAPLNTDLESPKLILPSSVQNQNRVLSMLKQAQDPAIGQCQHTLHNLHKKSMRTQMHRTWFPSRMASSTSVLFKSTQEATMANKQACLPSKRARLASFSSFSLCYRKETKMLCGNCCSKRIHFAIISYNCCFFKSQYSENKQLVLMIPVLCTIFYFQK